MKTRYLILLFMTAIIFRIINVWLSSVFSFFVIFSFGAYEVYYEYKTYGYRRSYLSDWIWLLVKYFVYGLVGAFLIAFCEGDDPNSNYYLEHLEPR